MSAVLAAGALRRRGRARLPFPTVIGPAFLVRLLCLSFAGLACGQETRVLFDGRTLAGWEGDPRFWSVEDGAIVGRSTAEQPLERTTYLIWRGGELRDFELALEFQLVRGNSGVQLRSREVGHRNVAGYQVDLADEQGYTGALYEQFGRGFLAQQGESVRYARTGERTAERFAAPQDFAGLSRPGAWNRLEVRARAETLEVRLNGRRTCELGDLAGARASLSGLLALQLHSGPPMEVRFRDLRLTDLGGVHDARERLDPQWIWTRPEAAPGEEAWFQREFELEERPRRATLFAAADDGLEAYLDGVLVASGEGTARMQQVDVTGRLRPGKNLLAIWVRNEDGPAALFAGVNAVGDGWQRRIGTDRSWRGAASEPPDWASVAASGPPWGEVHSFGPLGTEPWGRPPDLVKDVPLTALPGEALELPPGFRAELVYSVPRARQGSWVALCFDDRGRAYAADQFGFLYRIEPAPLSAEDPAAGTRVERVPVALGEAQGLLWAFGALYAVVNGTGRFPSGLHRVSDSDGDDRLDRSECLRALEGRDEHGPHAVVLGPDAESLYVVGGNEVAPPRDALAAFGPSFLPVGRLPVSVQNVELTQFELAQQGATGWICRTDRSGSSWELVATGLRNPYDLAFAGGELFTFDSDMEWDLGLPWYVPTRLLHVVPRADFGFRLGSARWPTWFPDSLPGILDVGRASPTGMLAGHALAFPARYREALFAGDWLKGRILVFHVKRAGASFTAEVEVFASGRPLPVTDLAAGPDGALYFTTGGRHTQSGLYRIVHAGGSEDGLPVARGEGARGAPVPEGEELPNLRDWQEILPRRPAPDERLSVHSALSALESEPGRDWAAARSRAEDPPGRVLVDLACARVAAPGDVRALLDELAAGELALEPGLPAQVLLRTLEVALLRAGELAPETRSRLAERLLARFPCGERELDRELGVLLASLTEAEERFVPLALERLAGAGDDGPEAFHWAFLLRHARRGWTPEGRRAYFAWLRAADIGFGGGRAVPVFLAALRGDALATLTAEERAELGELVEPGVDEGLPLAPSRPFVKSWSVAELEPGLAALESGRDLVRGGRVLREASCLTCHRFEGRGTALGPELDGLAGRLGGLDLLRSLLEPSREVPERYREVLITTRDERLHVGRIAGSEAGALLLRESHGARGLVRLPEGEIVSRELSRVSPMPEGLLDGFTLEEILDLVAYLLQDS